MRIMLSRPTSWDQFVKVKISQLDWVGRLICGLQLCAKLSKMGHQRPKWQKRGKKSWNQRSQKLCIQVQYPNWNKGERMGEPFSNSKPTWHQLTPQFSHTTNSSLFNRLPEKTNKLIKMLLKFYTSQRALRSHPQIFPQRHQVPSSHGRYDPLTRCQMIFFGKCILYLLFLASL